MPAHITHEVFASEVFEKAFGSGEMTPFTVFGAQGADFFLHNHRTKPSALIFGKLLHSEGYGRFVGHLIAFARERGIPFDSQFGGFTAAFATHAILDRAAHPFINYHAGWVVPFDPASETYRNCHAFYERIIDVFVLKIRKGTSINDYDFFSHADLGESMPGILLDSTEEAVVRTYPEYSGSDDLRRRIGNAYHDTRRYLAFTNPPDRESVRAAYLKEHPATKPPGRLLALLHPTELPDLDYLNMERREWNHPGNPLDRRTGSFLDLYERAVDTALPVVRSVAAAFRGDITTAEVAEAVGNGNLSDGEAKKTSKKLKYVKPLPLQEVLEAIYPA